MEKLNKFLILAVCVLLSGAVTAQSTWADEYVPAKSDLVGAVTFQVAAALAICGTVKAAKSGNTLADIGNAGKGILYEQRAGN